jgi:hypothetical protein
VLVISLKQIIFITTFKKIFILIAKLKINHQK